MLELTFVLLAVAAFISFIDWQKGLTLCVVTGLLQDPLRKVVEGQPVYFVVLVGVVFSTALAGAYFSKERLTLKSIQGWREQFRWPFTLFVVLVLLQGVHSFVRFGSPLITGIGLLVWLAPVFALMLSNRVVVHRGIEWVRRWMMLYCLLAMLFLSGVYLEYAGVEWPVLGELGEGLKIFEIGAILKAHSGFFRSSEIAAWHTATAACFLFLLFVGRRITATRLIIGVLAVSLLVGLGILTGRRKMLVEVAIFMTAYFSLVFWYQRSQGRKALFLVVGGVVALSALVEVLGPDDSDLVRAPRTFEQRQVGQYEVYALRGQSVVEDIPKRFLNLGLAPVEWAVDSLGWFGSGLGTGSQGTGGLSDANRNLGAAEGGLGKIAVELGIPGLFLILWLLLTMLKHVHWLLRATARVSTAHVQMACGFVAFLVAKTSSFVVASQAYSDMFVLLILGFVIGFLLAMPVVVRQDLEKETRHGGRRMFPLQQQTRPL